MPSSAQAIQAGTRHEQAFHEPPLLSLVTFCPIGNPLQSLSQAQRNLFFTYLLMSLHSQREEQCRRIEELVKKPALQKGAAIHLSEKLSRVEKLHRMQSKADEEIRRIMQSDVLRQKMALVSQSASEEGASAMISLSQLKPQKAIKGEAGKDEIAPPGGETGASGAQALRYTRLIKAQQQGEEKAPAAFGAHAQAVSGAIGQMVPVITDYSRGDEAKEEQVVCELHSRLRTDGYQTDDLMGSLLMVIEDDAWAGSSSGGEGLGSSSHRGTASRLSPAVPQKLRESMRDSAEVRLASVREMLRYYFLKHPGQYTHALAAALGITTDQEEDGQFMQERLAYSLASIGSFALAQKILYEIRRDMDMKNCLMRLGYRYDAKRKRLVLGKRTCGKPSEARGIIATLLASVKK